MNDPLRSHISLFVSSTGCDVDKKKMQLFVDDYRWFRRMLAKERGCCEVRKSYAFPHMHDPHVAL